jgi:hypothetical protein
MDNINQRKLSGATSRLAFVIRSIPRNFNGLRVSNKAVSFGMSIAETASVAVKLDREGQDGISD